MKRGRSTMLPLCLLAMCAATGIGPAVRAETEPDAILGAWVGRASYAGESKAFALRVDKGQKIPFVMFFFIPEMKFHNFGPFPLERQGDVYKNTAFSFTLSPDGKRVTGSMSFDGHDLTVELERGAIPPAPTATPIPGRVARPAWTFKTAGPVWSSPVLADGNVYFGSSDGNVYALNADSGKSVWTSKTGGRVMGRPTVDGAFLFALSDDGGLYKLDRRSGKAVWKFDTHGGGVARDLPSPTSATYDYLASAPTVADGIVYVGSADKRLYAVDAGTGKERWHLETQGIVRSTPAVADGRVFFGSYDNRVYAADAKTGELRWKFDTLQPVVSSPLVVDGSVFIGSRSSDLFAFDAASGAVRWKYFYWSSWVESSARIYDRVLYVGSSDHQQLFAIDAASGRRVWNVATGGSTWSSPAVTAERVYIGVVGVAGYFIDHRGGFLAVDRSSGAIDWQFPMGAIEGAVDSGVASSPAVGKGLVYFGGLDGTFYAFRTDGK